ncbi:hypothetical protein DM01DRAFT_1151610 [Hesseltinella vesiculosa]|uniref:Uncharacterized protein n=1 Tax=Hesseltinella vesiculosa TaxID=101127 RepID=A0A1X2G6G5_9FUNG|nr:hypothetical protein DM01DRAFT_1151610 [Hesseltinella vesiculosa]
MQQAFGIREACFMVGGNFQYPHSACILRIQFNDGTSMNLCRTCRRDQLDREASYGFQHRGRPLPHAISGRQCRAVFDYQPQAAERVAEVVRVSNGRTFTVKLYSTNDVIRSARILHGGTVEVLASVDRLLHPPPPITLHILSPLSPLPHQIALPPFASPSSTAPSVQTSPPVSSASPNSSTSSSPN